MDKEYKKIIEEPQKINESKKMHILTIREIQCKVTESYHSIHQTGKKVQLMPNIGKRTVKSLSLRPCWWGCQLIQVLWRAIWQQVMKMKVIMSRNSIRSRQSRRHVWRCLLPCWKQLKYPSTRERISKLYCSYTMEYNSMCHQRSRSYNYNAKAETHCRTL